MEGGNAQGRAGTWDNSAVQEERRHLEEELAQAMQTSQAMTQTCRAQEDRMDTLSSIEEAKDEEVKGGQDSDDSNPPEGKC